MNSASELDSLRSQVADLSRELAEQARVSRVLNRRLDFQGQDQGKRAGMFRAIIKGIVAAMCFACWSGAWPKR